MNFPTPSNNYFNGILRNTKVHVSSTSSHFSPPNYHTALIQNNLDYYWHSQEDSSFNQYAEIILPYNSAKVTSYMISSGNNGKYYLKSWKLNCTNNGKDWTTIDQHKNAPEFTASKQMKVFSVNIVKLCKVFRFVMNGVESKGRNFMYIGPVEFYGTLRNDQIVYHRNSCRQSHMSTFFIIFIVIS